MAHLAMQRYTTFTSVRMREVFEKHLERMMEEGKAPERVAQALIEQAIVMRDR
jgi:hypothetical protein